MGWFSERPVNVTCPNCQHQFKASGVNRGKAFGCPRCEAWVIKVKGFNTSAGAVTAALLAYGSMFLSSERKSLEMTILYFCIWMSVFLLIERKFGRYVVVSDVSTTEHEAVEQMKTRYESLKLVGGVIAVVSFVVILIMLTR